MERTSPGTLINERYELIKFVGKGAMGAVYQARDIELDRLVAIKTVLNLGTDQDREQARNEARTLATLSHPNVMQIYDVATVDEQILLIAEWIDGEPLNKMHRQLLPHEVLACGIQILRGLNAAHQQGIFHRDIKPANLMINAQGRVVLLDFGVAFRPEQSSGETIAGSPRYTSPEVLEGQPPSIQSDLYSVAVVLSELAAGRPVLPELAPLPLYRYLKDEFALELDQLLDGLYPPLIEFFRDIFSGQTRLDTKSAIAKLQDLYRQLSNDDVEAALEPYANNQSPDLVQLDFVLRITEEALDSKEVSPKAKAGWFAFQDHIHQLQNADFELPVAPSVAKRRIGKIPFSLPNRFASKKVYIPIIASSAAVLAILLSLLVQSRSSTLPETTTENAQVKEVVKEALKEAVKEAVEEAVTEGAGEDAPEEANTSAASALAEVSTETKILKPKNAAPSPEKEQPDSESSTKKSDRIAKVALKKLNQKVNERPRGEIAPSAQPTKKAPPPPVKVHFAANAWAELSVDGIALGRIPSGKAFVVSPGARVIRLESPFIEPFETKIQIEAKEGQKFRFSLTPRSKVQTIVLEERGQLIINGKDYGEVQEKTLSLPYGVHEIFIKRGETIVTRKNVQVGPNSEQVIRF